jgi:hypothetical protein
MIVLSSARVRVGYAHECQARSIGREDGAVKADIFFRQKLDFATTGWDAVKG